MVTDVPRVAQSLSCAPSAPVHRPLPPSGGIADRRYIVAVAVMIILGLALVGYTGSSAQQFAFAKAFVFGGAVAGLGLAWSYGGLYILGQGVFFGSGAYTYAILANETTLNAGIVLLLSAAMPGAIALLICVPILWRLRGLYFAIALLTLSFVAEQLALTFGFTGQWNGIRNIRSIELGASSWTVTTAEPRGALIVATVFLLGIFAVALLIVCTRFGSVLVLLRDDEGLATQMGYRPMTYFAMVLTLNGLIAGASGALYASIERSVFPELLGFSTSGRAVLWFILGGVGSIAGPVLGAITFNALQSTVSGFLSGRWPLVQGLLLLVVARWARGGIYGLLQNLGRLVTRVFQSFKARRDRQLGRDAADGADRFEEAADG